MKTKQRKSAGCIGPLLLLAILAAGGYYLLIKIPQNAAARFGPPAKDIGLFQRVKYSMDLSSHADDLEIPAQAGAPDADFTIESGEAPGITAVRMQEAGIIRSAEIFTTYLIYSGKDKGIQAGDYHLNPGLTAIQIADKLQDATPENATLVILPGWRMEEVAASLPTSGLSVSPDEFLELAQNTNGIDAAPAGIADGASLEGYLFPDTYEIKRGATTKEVLDTIINHFNNQMTSALKKGFKKNGLSIYQAVTLASMVQKEAVNEDEQPTIASVFINRLAAGMNLESDPTVQYAIGYDDESATWWKNPLTADDLHTDSPYNTYLYGGLPPAPISEPGLSALQAVASPEKTTYYYFRSKCDGSGYHSFAETFQEHVNNACP
jgi:UPF0755 protein